ncbi:MAG TPA: hypothetical protein VHQ22_14015 [Terriglobales bacterium]|jgi:hypothetical protein|nr:hypothetical protein [Terriglobales bacterium]
MPELKCLIAGIYADDEGCIYVDMREFLVQHGMPDKPEVREAAWDEMLDIFSGLTIFELFE